MSAAKTNGIARFFDDFVEAFATFDGKKVSSLFVTPAVALKRDGTLQGFADPREVETYYQAALDRYRASGCHSCRYSNLEVQIFSGVSAIGTASWDLLHEDGSVVAHWRQAYFLSYIGDNWRAYGSTFVSA